MLPALLRKIHESRYAGTSLESWGDGSPPREFLYVGDIIDVGTGEDCTIQDLAEMLAGVVGFEGPFARDSWTRRGTPQKLLDDSRINKLGQKARSLLEEGPKTTYHWHLENVAQ